MTQLKHWILLTFNILECNHIQEKPSHTKAWLYFLLFKVIYHVQLIKSLNSRNHKIKNRISQDPFGKEKTFQPLLRKYRNLKKHSDHFWSLLDGIVINALSLSTSAKKALERSGNGNKHPTRPALIGSRRRTKIEYGCLKWNIAAWKRLYSVLSF